MKKKFSLVLLASLFALSTMFFFACSANQVTVKYYIGNQLHLTESYDTGLEKPASAPDTATGYKFEGWYFSSDGGVTFGDAFTKESGLKNGEYNVYAKISPINYTIRYQKAYDFAYGDMTAGEVKYDEEIKLRANGFTRAGYAFGGWATVSGGEAVYTDQASIKNLSEADGAVIDLYAVWNRDENRSIVNYYNGDKKVAEREPLANNKFNNFTYSLEGYDFDGWFTEDWQPLDENSEVDGNGMSVLGAFIISGMKISDGVVTSYKGNANYISIPGYYSGTKVTKIGKEAFAFQSIQQVYIPNTVFDIDEKAFYFCGALDTVILEDSIEYIRLSAFMFCARLKDISLENTALKEIGDKAFYGCKSISYINLPETVTKIGFGAFGGDLKQGKSGAMKTLSYSDSRLKEIVLPFIGGSAEDNTYINYIFGGAATDSFYDATGREIDGYTGKFIYKSLLPDTLKKITVRSSGDIIDNAFTGCVFLEELIVEDGANVRAIGENAFFGSIKLKRAEGIWENVETVGDYAFAGCKLTTADFGSKLREVGDLAFYKCELTEISLPQTIVRLGDGAFYDCKNLTDVTIDRDFSNSHTDFYVGDQIFHLENADGAYVPEINIWVPNGSESNKPYINYRNTVSWMDYASRIYPVSGKGTTGFILDGDVLAGYIGNEKELVIPEVREISDFAFHYKSWIRTVKLPDGLEKIGKQAFYHCYNLGDLDFPVTLKEIGASAFTGFYIGNEITRVILPEGFETLGDGAFMLGYNIVNVRLPSTIKYIGYLAFGSASVLEKFYVLSKEPPEVGKYTSGGAEDCNIFAYINMAKLVIYVQGGRIADGENAGRTYAEVYKETLGFVDFASYVKPLPLGNEAGTYSDGELRIDLDGNDCAELFFDNISIAIGTYVIEDQAISMIFPEQSITGTYADRVLTLEYESSQRILKEPMHYYDKDLWSNLRLYYNGKGDFDMYSSYFTLLTYEIEGNVFKLNIDGNNTDESLEEYWGVHQYIGTINDKIIEIEFYLNNYKMTYKFELVEKNTSDDGIEGRYSSYLGETKFVTFEFLGNGICNIYIGVNEYLDLRYTVTDNTIVIDFMTLIWTLDILENGNLGGDIGIGTGYEIFFKE